MKRVLLLLIGFFVLGTTFAQEAKTEKSKIYNPQAYAKPDITATV